MIPSDRERLIELLNESRLKSIQSKIIALLDEKYANPKHGHFNDWKNIVESLPDFQSSDTNLELDTVSIGNQDDISDEQKQLLKERLLELNPWRKGPFNIFGIHVDTEWRSDWKWARMAPQIDLQDKQVLDIGCGNGYYALRMQAMGASLVLGIDPSWHYAFQFQVLQKYLAQIYSMLRSGGQFVLETLIINDKEADILIPNERYANMRNVWMIPSIELLSSWLEEAGFRNVNVVDTTMTTIEEQRQTEWMTRYSLEQALKPEDHTLTIEGYQAPLRATVISEK